MFKKLLKALGLFVLVLCILFAGFYFWAGRGTYPLDQYSQITRYSKPAPPKDTFTVVTYNIGYLSGMTNNLPMERSEEFVQSNMDSAIRLFRKLDADFVGFQEIDLDARRSHFQNQPEIIADQSGFAQSAVAINWDKRYVPFPYWPPRYHFGKIVSAQAVISKYPITNHERMVFTKPVNDPFWRKRFYTDRLAQVCQINIGREKPLILINIHLEAFDLETRGIQTEHVLNIYNEYADHPVLLIGDFNARPPAVGLPEGEREPTIGAVLNEKLKEATFVQGQSEPDGGLTYPSANPAKRIDYIFYNDQIQKLEGRVVTEAGTISDHLPVWMRFTVK